MKKFFSIALIALLGMSADFISAQNQSGTKRVATLCDIVASPEKYVGKRVRFIAVYQTALSMPPLLTHPACDQVSVLPSFDTKNRKSESVWKGIENELLDDGSGVFGKREFTFTGILIKDPDGNLPIVGILRDHTMSVRSADMR